MNGRVHALFTKPKVAGENGLRKIAQSSIHITKTGVAGDWNDHRMTKLAGDLDSAVLLFPLETLHALNAEGWALEPGHLGENIITTGIPYDALQPGTTWRIGSVEVQISRPCAPCNQLLTLPAGKPNIVKALNGRRGWYARVLDGGIVHARDPIAQTATVVTNP